MQRGRGLGRRVNFFEWLPRRQTRSFVRVSIYNEAMVLLVSVDKDHFGRIFSLVDGEMEAMLLLMRVYIEGKNMDGYRDLPNLCTLSVQRIVLHEGMDANTHLWHLQYEERETELFA